MRTITSTIRWLLLALLVITPWFFGGVWASVQWVLMLVASVLLALDLVTRFSDEDRPNLVPSAWLPPLLGIALGLFQLVGWPAGLATTFAPGTVSWRTELTQSVEASRPNAASDSETSDSKAGEIHLAGAQDLALNQRICRSLYAVATREYLALLTLAMAIFVLASMHFVDRQSVVWFFAAVGTCGAALTFFGLVQRLSWNGKFYWFFEPLYGSAQSFGPFVNRNNGGGFLNLCLAAGLGFLVWLHWNPAIEASESSSSSSSSRRRGSRSGGSSRSSQRRERTRESARREATEILDAAESDIAMPGEQDFADDTLDAEADRATDLGTTDDSLQEPPTPNTPTNSAPSDAEPRSEHDLLDAYRRSRRAEDTTAPPASSSTTSPSSSRSRSSSRGERSRSREKYSLSSNPTSYGSASSVLPTQAVVSLKSMLVNYIGNLDAPRAGALAIVGLTAGGVLCTASRGSILAMFAAAMVTIITLAVRRGNQGYAAGLLLVLLVGAGMMSWSGQTEFVQSRFEEMFNDESPYGNARVPNWFEALRAWPQFPLAGTGLGTYRLVYMRYQDRFMRDIVHMHAENQFIQSLVEGGVIAFSLLITAIVLTGLAIVRLYRTGGPVNTALAIAGTFGLTSQIVGGLFDFGMYIPSNTILMAALCGMVIGRAALLSVWPAEALTALDNPQKTSGYQFSTTASDSRTTSGILPDERHTVAGAARVRRSSSTSTRSANDNKSAFLGLNAPATVVTFVIGFLLLGCLFGSLEMNKAGRLAAATRRTNRSPTTVIVDPVEIAAIAAPLATSLPLRWDDAEAHQRLAELRIEQYRAATYQTLLANKILTTTADPAEAAVPANTAATEETEPAVDVDLWSRSGVYHLHGTIRQLERANKLAEVAQLRDGEAVREYLVPAVRDLLLARHYAPTIPQVHYLLAELSAVIPQLGDEQVHLQRAQLLSPGNATLWYWSGVLDLNSERKNSACQDWHKSLVLSPLHLDDVMRTAQGKITIRQLLDDTLPFQADLLLRVTQSYFSGEERARYRVVFLKKAEEAIPKTELPPAELAYVTASILNLSGRGPEAATHYADAISRKGTELYWRHEYARLLISLREYDKAHEQAAYLARANPKSVEYKRLLEEVIGKRLRRGLDETTSDD